MAKSRAGEYLYWLYEYSYRAFESSPDCARYLEKLDLLVLQYAQYFSINRKEDIQTQRNTVMLHILIKFDKLPTPLPPEYDELMQIENLYPHYKARAFPERAKKKPAEQIIVDALSSLVDLPEYARFTDHAQCRVHYNDKTMEAGFLSFDRLEIDVSAPLDDILADITTEVCSARMEIAFYEQLASLNSNDRPLQDMPLLNAEDCPGYGPCSDGRCERQPGKTSADKVLRTEVPRRMNPIQRAIGIWLYDYIVSQNDQGYSATPTQALRAFGDVYGDRFADMGLTNCDDSGFSFFLRMTKRCIQEKKVLPFTKKKATS